MVGDMGDRKTLEETVSCPVEFKILLEKTNNIYVGYLNYQMLEDLICMTYYHM
jgi:hypothetical protein